MDLSTRRPLPRAVLSSDLRPRVSAVQVGASVPPWATMGAHRIAYSALAYFERGHTRLRLNGRRLDLYEGDCVLVPSGSLADIDLAFAVSDDARRSRWWSVAFEGALADTGAERPNASYLSSFVGHLPIDPRTGIGRVTIPVELRRRWMERMRELREHLDADGEATPRAVQALLTLFAIDVGRLTGNAGAGDLAVRPALAAFFRYAREHLAEPVELRTMAGVLGFSSAYLTDLVRRETGRPAMAWVRELRMQRAELLLNDTDLPVERIAHAVGYEGVRSFRRSFTATRGLAPDHWRRGRTPARRPVANGDALIVRDRNGFRSGPPPDVEIERTVPSA